MKYFLYTITLIALTLNSCVSFEEIEYKGINNVSLTQNSEQQGRLKLNVKIDNPNTFDIKIKKSDLTLYVMGNDAGKVDLEEAFTLIKKTEADYDIVVLFDQDKLMKAAMASGLSILTSGKISLRLKGWVKGKAYGFGKKVDVDFKENISTKELKL